VSQAAAATCDTDAPIAPLGADLRWYQRAAERRALSLQAYGLASAKLQAKAPSGNWGVIMDVDETSLDNSAYQHSRADLGVGFSPGSWTAWVNQKAAIAIPGAPDFTAKVHALGGKVVLVTNRKDGTECPQTEDNLHAVGVVFDQILCQTGPSDKNPRFQQVQAQMNVVMFVGDNIQDFPALTQDIRKQPDAAFADFGDKFILVPNPMYGSWEKNLD
jgi:5'-nucleotidase (lipoprotein e(P4) family)